MSVRYNACHCGGDLLNPRHSAPGPIVSLMLVLALLAGTSSLAPAQTVRTLVNNGNTSYKEQKFSDAEVDYRKALEKEQGLVQGHFNLGDALSKEGKFDDAVKEYEIALSKAEQNGTKAFAHYNIGNSLMKQQRYQDAVQSYVNSLKLEPNDEDTKYNLSYALEKLKQKQQQQNQQKNKNQDKNNQNKNDQQKQDQQKQQNKPQDDKQKQQPSPQQQQKQMSRADAQRILDVLKNNEKDVQKKLHTHPAARARTDKDW